MRGMLLLLTQAMAFVKDNVQPFVAGATSAVQLTIGLLSYFGRLEGTFWEAPFLWIAAIWLVCIGVAVWPLKRPSVIVDRHGTTLQQPRLSVKTRLALAMAGTACAACALGMVLWEGFHVTRARDHPIIPGVGLPPGFSWFNNLLPVISVEAAERPTVTMALVEGYSSLAASYPEGALELQPSNRLLNRFLEGQDNQTAQEKLDVPVIREWLRARSRRLGRQRFLPRLDDRDDVLIRLSRDRPDIVKVLMPRTSEVAALSEDQQALVTKWVVRYVGQWNPRLRISLDNTANASNLQVRAVKLVVRTVNFEREAGLAPTLRSAVLDTFYLKLAPDRGPQVLRLDSQGQGEVVRAHETTSFDLVICPDPERSDRIAKVACEGYLYLQTSQGELPAGRLKLSTYNCWNGGALVSRP